MYITTYHSNFLNICCIVKLITYSMPNYFRILPTSHRYRRSPSRCGSPFYAGDWCYDFQSIFSKNCVFCSKYCYLLRSVIMALILKRNSSLFVKNGGKSQKCVNIDPRSGTLQQMVLCITYKPANNGLLFIVQYRKKCIHGPNPTTFKFTATTLALL
jgi:hypothetical protein